MKIGYIRADKKDDAFYGEQYKALEECERVFEDIDSCGSEHMKELEHMIDYMRPEDHVYIYQMDRFGLNTRDLMMLVYDFLERGIHITSVKDGIDTSTQEGRVLLKIFKALNMCEQNVVPSTLSVVEPISSNVVAAKSQSTSNVSPSFGYLSSVTQQNNLGASVPIRGEMLRNAGRRKGLTPQAKEKAETAAAMYQEGVLSMRDIAQNLNISTATLYSYLRHEKVI